MSPIPEKKTEKIAVWVGEMLLLELSKMAQRQDRKLSEYIGVILQRHVFGHRNTDEDELASIEAGRSGAER